MVSVFSFPQKEPELPVEAEVLWMTHFLACYVSLFTFHRFSHKHTPPEPAWQSHARSIKHADTLMGGLLFRWRRHKKRF